MTTRTPSVHAKVFEGVAKSRCPLKVVVFKCQQPCPDTVSLDLDPLLHSSVDAGSHKNEELRLAPPERSWARRRKHMYRGTSLTRQCTPIGPYRRPMLRVVRGS